MNKNFKNIGVLFEENFPSNKSLIAVLRQHTHWLPIPHNLEIKTDKQGQYYLQPVSKKIGTEYQCISRLSVAFAATKHVRKIMKDIISTKYLYIKIESIENNINKNAHTAFHLDERDIGIGAKLLRKNANLKSKMKEVKCNKKVI